MLNLYEILKKIILENVTPTDINDAIDKKLQVIITYSDDKNRAPKKRLIEPYVFGITKKGNSVIRAYQYEGDTFRGKPKWKLFRIDRITSWNPTENHFNEEPMERGWNAEPYNNTNDKLMVSIFNKVNFDQDTENNPYIPNSDLYKLKNKINNLQKSKPVNISQLTTNGPKNNGTIKNFVDTNDLNFQKMLKRNLDITKKEKDKRGFSLSKQNNDNNNLSQLTTNGPKNNDTIKNFVDTNDLNFQKMLKRNLDITKKEKDKRGFSLSSQNN